MIGGYIGFNPPAIGSSSTPEAQSVMDFCCMVFWLSSMHSLPVHMSGP